MASHMASHTLHLLELLHLLHLLMLPKGLVVGPYVSKFVRIRARFQWKRQILLRFLALHPNKDIAKISDETCENAVPHLLLVDLHTHVLHLRHLHLVLAPRVA